MAKKKKTDKPQEIPPGFELLHTLRGGYKGWISGIEWSPDGRFLASGGGSDVINIWEAETGSLVRTLKGHTNSVISVAWSPDGTKIGSGGSDNKLILWGAKNGKLLNGIKGHTKGINGVAWSPDGQILASCGGDGMVCLWEPESDWWLHTFERQGHWSYGLAWSPCGRMLASGCEKIILLWDTERKGLLRRLEGHTDTVLCVAWSTDGELLVSGSADNTIKVWNVETGRELYTLEGHKASVTSVGFCCGGRILASLSDDRTISFWLCNTWEQTDVSLETVAVGSECLAFHPRDDIFAAPVETRSEIRIWQVDYDVLLGAAPVAPSVKYTNAKVVLVGESGVGKSGLGHRLVEDKWVVTDSTHGMKVWPLELEETKSKQDMGREVWLWDLAGQPDYRLVHQLYFDETALALMLFNPAHPEDPFREVGEWEKGMRTALGHEPAKLLVAARTDRGGATISNEKIERFCAERGYIGYFETSAKLGEGCKDLKKALAKCIPWDQLPGISTTKVFKALKDAVIRLKGEKMVLIQFAALKKQLEAQLGEGSFEEAELRTVVRLLAGQGMVKALAFGDFVLLQPEQINNYASSVIRQAREHVDGIGTVDEDKVLGGGIDFKDMPRVSRKDEDILLRAMLQMFLEQSLCIREETTEGMQLVFPSQFKREMPEIPEHPHICVKYRFGGNLAAIYATLVVRLIYSKGFEKKELWKNAAEFLTEEGKRIGFMMTYLGDGVGEITVFFEEDIPDDTRVTFIKYIHEHLLRRAVDVERQREYVCTNRKCGKAVENREAIKFRLAQGKNDITCSYCDKRIILYDLIEKKFNQDEFLRRVQELDMQAGINLDNESKELILVGQAISISGEAGQIYRPVTWSDKGIDGEIEFKDDKGRATGKKIYLQLKSGDSYLYERKGDGKEIFTVKNKRHIDYWQSQPCDVFLVHRSSDGVIRWMNVSEYLRGRKDKKSKQIEFTGEPFTVYTLLRLREECLAEKA